MFEKLDLKSIYPKNFNKNRDVSTFKNAEFNLPLVNAKHGNNGVMYYGRSSDFECAEMTIGIVGDGAIATGDVNPHPQKTGVLYNAYLIKPVWENVTRRQLFFFSSSLMKSIKLKFSYENKAGWEKVKVEKIQVPFVIKNNVKQVDFDFIESFIAELEAEKVAELEAYLIATDLKNYTLTVEEEHILDDFENLEWKEFNLQQLFGQSTRGKRLKSADRISGDLPFVTAGEAYEGISAYIGNDVEIFPKNTITIDMFGSAKYRNYRYGGDDHIAVVHTEQLPKLASLFITASIHKVSNSGQFDYSRNFYAKDADALNIFLPIQNQQPNYKVMQILISAIQKLIIKEVILYLDCKIEATRRIINGK